MSRIKIDKVVERKLYAESMGRYMNLECQVELFINDGDMIEKAHTVSLPSTKPLKRITGRDFAVTLHTLARSKRITF